MKNINMKNVKEYVRKVNIYIYIYIQKIIEKKSIKAANIQKCVNIYIYIYIYV